MLQTQAMVINSHYVHFLRSSYALETMVTDYESELCDKSHEMSHLCYVMHFFSIVEYDEINR
jgi:hypothetical protein